MKKLTVIGVGLIGGSIAIDLKKRQFAQQIVGVDNNPLHAATAVQLGIVDEVLPLEQAVADADIVVMAIPVDAALQLLPSLLSLLRKGQVVTDVCSVKKSLCDCVASHPQRGQFVASHPMAGTEASGPWAALSGLFDGNAAIICDKGKSLPDAVEVIQTMWEALYMRPIYMAADQHDIHAAYVSHLSHIVSFALALTVLDKEQEEKHIFNLASGGFDSTVRLAKSDSLMWTPIFVQNRENLLTAIDTFMDRIASLRESLLQIDEERVTKFIHRANEIKKILGGK